VLFQTRTEGLCSNDDLVAEHHQIALGEEIEDDNQKKRENTCIFSSLLRCNFVWLNV